MLVDLVLLDFTNAFDVASHCVAEVALCSESYMFSCAVGGGFFW